MSVKQTMVLHKAVFYNRAVVNVYTLYSVMVLSASDPVQRGKGDEHSTTSDLS